MLNVLPKTEFCARMMCVSLGLLKKANPATHGIKHNEPNNVYHGSDGPRSPSKSLSSKPPKISDVDTLDTMKSNMTKPSIERIVFHFEDGYAKTSPAGGGLNGVIGRPCMK